MKRFYLLAKPPSSILLVVVALLVLLSSSSTTTTITTTSAYTIIESRRNPISLIRTSTQNFKRQVRIGFEQRVAADPSFALKSVTEVVIAAGTQFAAEWRRRGTHRLLAEMDFIFPAILAAIFGKYYSMWKVAKTVDKKGGTTTNENKKKSTDVMLFGKLPVPSNAFQPYMLDGVTRPTIQQRFGSILAPVGPLFRAGVIASGIGYGTAAVLIWIRSIALPSYVPQTQTINVVSASIYTGFFMAIVSNLRYQTLQGIIEPCIDYCFRNFRNNKIANAIQSVIIFLVRLANGYLGSTISIIGMRYFGLQKLK